MPFYTDEYKHVLLAERTMARLLEREDIKPSDGAQCTRALVDAVRLKRDMRGVPDPRPVDVGKASKRQRRTAESSPVSLPAPSPDAAQAPSTAPESTPRPQ